VANALEENTININVNIITVIRIAIPFYKSSFESYLIVRFDS
jgi:hypothetical protein